ncbi:MAG TPA: hypothetical protein VHE35_05970, partial [Kofleriaceae bacterium]|nr:hypothetical protein [Kofleriaceae bacterium]
HRRNGEPPVSTSPLPPEQRTLDPEVSARVYQQIAPKVAACTAQVPASARGPDPFVYINLTVAIDHGVLSSSDVVPVGHDITDDGARSALESCVRDAASTVRVDAKGQADQAQYVLHYPVRIR